jgi:hypothetical protein
MYVCVHFVHFYGFGTIYVPRKIWQPLTNAQVRKMRFPLFIVIAAVALLFGGLKTAAADPLPQPQFALNLGGRGFGRFRGLGRPFRGGLGLPIFG